MKNKLTLTNLKHKLSWLLCLVAFLAVAQGAWAGVKIHAVAIASTRNGLAIYGYNGGISETWPGTCASSTAQYTVFTRKLGTNGNYIINNCNNNNQTPDLAYGDIDRWVIYDESKNSQSNDTYKELANGNNIATRTVKFASNGFSEGDWTTLHATTWDGTKKVYYISDVTFSNTSGIDVYIDGTKFAYFAGNTHSAGTYTITWDPYADTVTFTSNCTPPTITDITVSSTPTSATVTATYTNEGSTAGTPAITCTGGSVGGTSCTSGTCTASISGLTGGTEYTVTFTIPNSCGGDVTSTKKFTTPYRCYDGTEYMYFDINGSYFSQGNAIPNVSFDGGSTYTDATDEDATNKIYKLLVPAGCYSSMKVRRHGSSFWNECTISLKDIGDHNEFIVGNDWDACKFSWGDYTPCVTPGVTTGIATNITAFTATLPGTVTNTADVTEVGIKMGDTEYEKTSGSTSSFSFAATNLEGGKTYSYQAYAKKSCGTFYGEEKSFKTSRFVYFTGGYTGGDWGNIWDVSTKGDDNIFYKEFTSSAFEFKFSFHKGYENDWYGAFDVDGTKNKGITASKTSGNNNASLSSLSPSCTTPVTVYVDTTTATKKFWAVATLRNAMYVTGSFAGCAWDEATCYTMTKTDGVFSYVFNNIDAGTYQFKVTNGAWGDNNEMGYSRYSSSKSILNGATVSEEGAYTIKNIQITTTKSQKLTIYCDEDNVYMKFEDNCTQPTAEHFTYNCATSKTYTGTAQPMNVTWKSGTGSGAITVYYKQGEGDYSTDEPVNAGTYTVAIKTAAGGSYCATSDYLVLCDNNYTIAKAPRTISLKLTPAAVCKNGQITLSSTATAGDSDSKTYSIDAGDTSKGSISGTTLTCTTANTTIKVWVSITGDNYADATGFATATVYADPTTGTLSASPASVCSGGTSTVSTNSLEGISAYQWKSSSTEAGTYNPIDGATTASYTTGAISAKTYYKVEVTSNNGCKALSATPIAVDIKAASLIIEASPSTVNPYTPVTLTAKNNSSVATNSSWTISGSGSYLENSNGVPYTTSPVTGTSSVVLKPAKGVETSVTATATVDGCEVSDTYTKTPTNDSQTCN